MPDNQVVELLRDMLGGLRDQLQDIRSNQREVQDQLTRLTESTDRTHADIYDRLRAIETTKPAPAAEGVSLAKLAPYWRYAWPVLVILAVLWRDATPTTKRKALSAAGLDVQAGASWQAPPSSTWAMPGHPR